MGTLIVGVQGEGVVRVRPDLQAGVSFAAEGDAPLSGLELFVPLLFVFGVGRVRVGRFLAGSGRPLEGRHPRKDITPVAPKSPSSPPVFVTLRIPFIFLAQKYRKKGRDGASAFRESVAGVDGAP